MVSDYNPYENESYQQDIYSSQNTQPEAAESTAQASQIPPTAQISSPEQSAPSQASPSPRSDISGLSSPEGQPCIFLLP